MPEQRAELCDTALKIARLFSYENIGTVEFLVDQNRRFYFTEIKPRLQVEHPLTEMRARVDLVREQIRIAFGETLSFAQEDLRLQGWAVLCRINAEDPLNQMPSPGAVRVRLPIGAEIRVDTYIADHGIVPPEYNPLVAKVTTWGTDREACLQRMRRALQDLWLPGGRTNLPLLHRVLGEENFCDGAYSTDLHMYLTEDAAHSLGYSPDYYRDLAATSAVLYIKRHETVEAVMPERLVSGWHRDSRRLPE
jgi:acetyl/propionyl-CoA carboxylase alpha subunit